MPVIVVFMFESLCVYVFECCAQDFVILFRMLFAVCMGYIIGRERQRVGKSAGIRTHIIVCMSTAAVVSVSMYAFTGQESGARVVGAVITGIGFLGAGQIMTSQGKVSGITTAASIWTNALIGAVIGVGYYVVGFVATMLLFFTFRLRKDDRDA